jgi:hypothetical protein
MRVWIILFPKFSPGLDPAGVQHPPKSRQTSPTRQQDETPGKTTA